MIQLMAIVNLTPDSFFAPSRVWGPGAPGGSLAVGSPGNDGADIADVAAADVAAADVAAADYAEAAVERIHQFAAEGASIVDLGAVSTRPGSEDPGLEAEWARLEPVLKRLAAEGICGPAAAGCEETNAGCAETAADGCEVAECAHESSVAGISRTPDAQQATGRIRISIDTFRSEIVRRAHAIIGPFIVNDISAGEDDPEMLPTVAELGLPYIAMHKRGGPQTMDALCDYPDGVMEELLRYFEAFQLKAEALGISDWVLDPGLGFAKTDGQNWEILANLERLKKFERSILIGAADKRFTRRVPEWVYSELEGWRPMDTAGAGFPAEDCGAAAAASAGENRSANCTANARENSSHSGAEREQVAALSGTEIAHRLAIKHGAGILRVHTLLK